MKTINLAILFSGNGSNLENIYKKMQGLIVECESHTAIRRICEQSETINTSIVLNANESSLRGEVEAIQKDKIIDCHDLQSKSRNDKTTSDSAEVSLDNFVGFQARKHEIELDVHRVLECAESRESARESNAHIKLNFPIAISSNESAFGITRCVNLGLKCEVIDYKKNKGDFFEKIIATLESHNINLVILAGFMKILPPAFNAKFRALNIHPSILPLFKGAHAIAESFESDMKIAGVSVHFVSDELDSGALIAQDIIHKINGEKLESFETRIHALEYEIYPKAIEKAVQILAYESKIKARDLAESNHDLPQDSRKSNHKSTQDSQDLCESKSK